MPLPKGPRPKLPPSPVNPLRQLVQEGREQVGRARDDIRSLADDLRGTAAQPPTEAETPPSSPSAGTACLPCVPPNTIIFTNPGVKTIEEISIGDKVFDTTGNFSEVTEAMQRPYNGEVIAITVPYQNEPIILTPEHPVLAIKAHICRALQRSICFPGKDNPRCRECQLKRDYQPKFISAGELSATGNKNHWVKHILLMPRLKATIDVETLDITSIAGIGYEELPNQLIKPKKENAHNRGRSAIPVKRHIRVNNDFMKVLGFYLAEGSVLFQKRGATLRFDFGKHEPQYAQEVITLLEKVFEVRAKIIKSTPSTVRVQALSSIVAYFFANLLGKGALYKQIPLWILTLPTSKQISLIEGYWQGDGYSRREKRIRNSMSFQATTVSQQLAYCLRLMLHRLDIIHNLSKRNGRDSFIEGRKIIGNNPRYNLSIGGPSAIKLGKMLNYQLYPWRFLQSHLAGIDDNWIYLPIKKVERHPYSGLVYNITTKPSNTYTANGIIVHNCTRDHFSTTSAALSEGLRFARSEGMKDPEVTRRLGIALDELNIMERIDLAPDQIGMLNEPARKLAIWALNSSRELRHAIGEIKTVDDMEKAATQAAKVRDEFMTKYGKVRESSAEECEECNALETLKTYIERRKTGET